MSIDEVPKRYNSMDVQLMNRLCGTAGERKTKKKQQDIDHLILFEELAHRVLAILTDYRMRLTNCKNTNYRFNDCKKPTSVKSWQRQEKFPNNLIPTKWESEHHSRVSLPVQAKV